MCRRPLIRPVHLGSRVGGTAVTVLAGPATTSSAAVSAQGAVKASPGSVNVPITIGGQLVRPGDAIVADDDGVVCVPREALDRALDASQVRIEKEEAARQAFRDGEPGLDRYGLRTKLKEPGVEYVTAEEYGR